MDMEQLLELRKERGLKIVNSCQITKSVKGWLVPSQSTAKKYLVRFRHDEPECSCPDFESRHIKCKHIFAVEMTITKQTDREGNIIITKRISYSQNWTAYDKSQTSEKISFMNLLNDLCESIQEPIHLGAGRPSLLLRDMVFVSAMKVYTTFSLRRFASDMKMAQEKGFIMRTPHYSRVARYMENPQLTPIIQNLIKVSSLPLSSVESNFAVDSSGFSTGIFSRWFDFRYGRSVEEKGWLKSHIMIGVKTNVVTAVKLTEDYGSDTKQFTGLLSETAENFQVKEVSADKCYISKDNLEAVQGIGATPYIPFKKNTVIRARSPRVWKKMYHYFMLNQEEFMEHYHKRSNVEATFSMVKRKFGVNVRSKTKTAQINEILLKFLCHNICVLIQEMNELGIEPNFSSKQF